ncbi:ParB N-terminal domain-containing protein [Streptomyces sp. FxanaA7]|uniref:ParB N-terminal domain-containing protein n=1 Tax=Streptomyces sp. FxanaA7 TaxID=1265492 RepID=UPI0005ED50A0|nr:ParB N-terminal domain-containing protein [Streptomyces sp. FxanaA7]
MTDTTTPPPMDRAAKAEALLLRFTAEAHRRKWDYDRGLDGDGVPLKSEAFDALHRLGEEMRVELEKLRALPASVVVPAADRAALRDRIADKLATADGWQWAPGFKAESPAWRGYQERADMVLAELPAPADRAAVLEEAADTGFHIRYGAAIDYAEHYAALLRRMAVESAAVDRVAVDWFAAARFVEAMNEACDQKPCEACTTREDVASELRRVAAETPPAETHAELQVWPLQRILTEVRCGSQDWPWEEEWADLARRHAKTGYLDRLEEKIRENGITMPVLIGSDGRLWDGHHRVCIAVRLGIGYVPVEVVPTDNEQTNPAPPDLRCTHCGKPVRLITGTLSKWWVHEPGGNTVCHPEHAAASTRAEPGAGDPAQSGNDTTTPVGYSGKGRLWCLTCPHPADEDLPVTIAVVQVGELCAGCGRDVVEIARATEQQPKEV